MLKSLLVFGFYLFRFPMHRPFLLSIRFCFVLFCFVLFCFALYFVSRSFIVTFVSPPFPSPYSCPWTPKTSSLTTVRLPSLPTGHHTSIPLVHFSPSRLDVAAAFPRILFVPILSASVWLSYAAPSSSSMILYPPTLLFPLSWACCVI